MAIPLTDAELRRVVRAEIAAEGTYTDLTYRLRGNGYRISEDRMRRVWLEEGGEVQRRGGNGSSLYAPGTGPLDGW